MQLEWTFINITGYRGISILPPTQIPTSILKLGHKRPDLPYLRQTSKESDTHKSTMFTIPTTA